MYSDLTHAHTHTHNSLLCVDQLAVLSSHRAKTTTAPVSPPPLSSWVTQSSVCVCVCTFLGVHTQLRRLFPWRHPLMTAVLWLAVTASHLPPAVSSRRIWTSVEKFEIWKKKEQEDVGSAVHLQLDALISKTSELQSDSTSSSCFVKHAKMLLKGLKFHYQVFKVTPYLKT